MSKQEMPYIGPKQRKAVAYLRKLLKKRKLVYACDLMKKFGWTFNESTRIMDSLSAKQYLGEGKFPSEMEEY